jgi:hypothetical protein
VTSPFDEADAARAEPLTLSVYKHGHTIPVALDDDGRPLCPQCAQPMTETAPEQWRCPDAVALETALAARLQGLLNRLNLNEEAR